MKQVTGYVTFNLILKTLTSYLLISADLSNAYSEVMLGDLEQSIEYVGEVTGMQAWEIELVISLSRLILGNNYIECSQGIYKLIACLAMGSSSEPGRVKCRT